MLLYFSCRWTLRLATDFPVSGRRSFFFFLFYFLIESSTSNVTWAFSPSLLMCLEASAARWVFPERPKPLEELNLKLP